MSPDTLSALNLFTLVLFFSFLLISWLGFCKGLAATIGLLLVAFILIWAKEKVRKNE